MINKYILILFFFFSSCSLKTTTEQEELVCIQINDRNGFSETVSSKERLKKYKNVNFLTSQPYKRVVRVIKKNSSSKKISKITSYHENGFLFQYLEAKDGRAFGQYKQWYQNGNIEVEANLIGGPASISDFDKNKWIFDKVCKAYDDKGNLISIFRYSKGILEGESIYYFKNGNVQKILPYKNNEIDGEVVEFNEKNEIILKENYKKGKKDGISQGFFEKEKRSFYEKYDKGVLLKGKYFSKDLELISEVKDKNGIRTLFLDNNMIKKSEYRNGKENGRIELFKKNKLQKIYHMKDGEKNGEEIEYFNIKGKERPKLSLNWKNGVIQGIAKTWYENGILQSQRKINQNKKDGSFSSWYKNGSIMFIEEYEMDILKSGIYYKKNEKKPVSKVVDGKGKVTIFDEEGIFIKTIKYENGLPKK